MDFVHNPYRCGPLRVGKYGDWYGFLSSEHAFPSKFWIYLEHCPCVEAVITGHVHLYRPSAPLLYEVASHV